MNDVIRCRSTSRLTVNRRMFTIGIFRWVWRCPQRPRRRRRQIVHYFPPRLRRCRRGRQLHRNRHLLHDRHLIIKSPTAIVTIITANPISYISSSPLTVSHRRLTRRPLPPPRRRRAPQSRRQQPRHSRPPEPSTRNFNSRRTFTPMENPISSTSSSPPITALIPSNSTLFPFFFISFFFQLTHCLFVFSSKSYYIACL